MGYVVCLAFPDGKVANWSPSLPCLGLVTDDVERVVVARQAQRVGTLVAREIEWRENDVVHVAVLICFFDEDSMKEKIRVTIYTSLRMCDTYSMVMYTACKSSDRQ